MNYVRPILKTIMHSSRMPVPPALYHTGASLSRGLFVQGGFCPGALCLGVGVSVQGGLCPGGSLSGDPPPRKRPSEGPETETLSGRNMGPETETPQKEHGTRDRDPLEGIWDQAARQKWHHTETPLWTDKRFWKHYLAPKLRLRAVKS